MRSAIKFGLLTTLGIAVWVLADHLWLHFTGPGSKIAFITPIFFNVWQIVALSLGIRALRSENNNVLSVGQGVKRGLAISLVYAVSGIIFFLLAYLIIGPSLLEGEAQSFGSDTPANQVLLQAFGGLFFGAIVGGLIYSTIIALILKRRPEKSS